MKENQYQHFIPKFLLRNISENGIHIYKFKNSKYELCEIDKTGGEDLLYGSFNCSLEQFFNKLETVVAQAIRKHERLSPIEEKYMKFFIQAMAYRSPSKNQTFSEEYNDFIKSNNMPKNEFIVYLEKKKKEFEMWLESFEKDYETIKFSNRHQKPLDDSDNKKFFPLLFKGLINIFPRIDKCFDIHIFESESDLDLILGETPTVSENFTPFGNMQKEKEIDLLHRNVMHWLPVAHNKVVFMYTKNKNIIAQKDRKLRKQDVNILNFCQNKKNSFFYSRRPNIDIPDLPANFSWTQHFNYIFGYKSVFK